MLTEAQNNAAFDMTAVEDGIWQIKEPWYAEHANMYLFEGSDYPLLIDAGIGTANVNRFLSGRGFNDVRNVVTHSHYDHVGGLRHFEPELLTTTRLIKDRLSDRVAWALDYFHDKDLDIEHVREKMGCDLREVMDGLQPFSSSRIEGCRVVDYTEVVDNGTFRFQQLRTSGHSPDSISFWDSDRGVLVTGDAIYNGEPYVELSDSDITQLIGSLQQFAALKVRQVLPGHNEVMDQEKFQRVLEEWISSLSKGY